MADSSPAEPFGAQRAVVPAPEVRRRSSVLHGRRTGRALRVEQRARVARDLPAIEIDLDTLDHPLALFPDAVTALRLEIGFGGGEHLAEEADRSRATGFIGCEPFRNGVAKMLDRIASRGLRNVRLYGGDAGEVLERLPGKCLDGVDLLYPDPWPKRRQRKRRFVSDAALAALARAMRPGAALRFATDIDDYAGWTLARVLRSPDFAWTARQADHWRLPWDGWSSTRYEAKALHEGRRPVYLTFLRR